MVVKMEYGLIGLIYGNNMESDWTVSDFIKYNLEKFYTIQKNSWLKNFYLFD